MNDQNQQGQQPQDQQKKPIICSPPGDTQYKKAKEAYLKAADEKIKELEARRLTKKVVADSKSEIACNVRKSLAALRDTVNEYNFLENCIAIYASKDLEQLSTTTKKDIRNKSDAFSKSFDETVVILKTTKKQLGAVNDLARKLYDALHESCNSEEVKHLRHCFAKNSWKPDLDGSVKDIVVLASHVNNQVDDLSESAVKTAGINAFINIGSIETFIDGVKKTGDEFTKNVKSTIANLQKEGEASAKTLTKALEDLSTSIQDKYKARNDKESWVQTRQVIAQDFPEQCKPIMKDLVEQAASSFNEEQQEQGN